MRGGWLLAAAWLPSRTLFRSDSESHVLEVWPTGIKESEDEQATDITEPVRACCMN